MIYMICCISRFSKLLAIFNFHFELLKKSDSIVNLGFLYTNMGKIIAILFVRTLDRTFHPTSEITFILMHTRADCVALRLDGNPVEY